MNTKTMKNKGGFTLIELLIVIGLLGALTALVLPRLAADREEAMGDVCNYNQAGTLRVLSQYYDMYGKYPVGLHNGLTNTIAGSTAMPGLPDAQAANMIHANTVVPLSANQATSLSAAGITSICSSTGLTSTVVADGVYVACCTTAWRTDENVGYTFDGIGIPAWNAGTGTPSWDRAADGSSRPGIVVCLWVAPTTDWSANKGDGGNSDWTKGSVELGISLAGKCPVPTKSASGGDPEFAYYMAYFKVYTNGAKARMIGTSCPECGVLNP